MIAPRYGAAFAAFFLAGAAGAVLLAGPALAAPRTSAAGRAVVTATAPPDAVPVKYTQAGSGNPPSQASLQPSTVTVLAGGTVTFTNTGSASLTLGGALKETVKPGASIRVPVPASIKDATYAYTATEDVRGLPVSNRISGQVVAKGTPSSPRQSGSSAPAGGSGGSQPPAGGQPGPVGPSGSGRSGGAPGSGGGPYVGLGLPGGVIAPLAPGATAYPNGPAPLVAPFATATPTTPAEPTTPGASSTSGPAAVAAPSTPSGESGTRSLGLPAAITAVVLIGVIAALVRVLLTHPAARAIPRRH